MAQKYKVFIRDRAVILTDGPILEMASENRKFLNWEDIQRPGKLLSQFLSEGLEKDLVLHCSDYAIALKQLLSEVEIIEAGGGLVRNAEGKYLMIFRRGSWDLPKGKAEPGETIRETALREVEEETGVFPLKILKGPHITHHLYQEKNGKCAIKKSYWFFMETEFLEQLKPQHDEDIEVAIWCGNDELRKNVSGAFPSIADVVSYFLGSSSTSGG